MFLLVVFGLPVAEIELREEKVSEETICILKTRGLFEKEVLHGVFEKNSERSDREEKCRQ